jgi:hypothetical protein
MDTQLHAQEVKWKVRIAGTGIEKVQIDRDPIVQWTVAKPLVLRPLGVALERKANSPKLLKNVKVAGNQKKLWSVSYAAQWQVRGTQASLLHVAMFSKHHALVGLSARLIQAGEESLWLIRSR